MKTSVKFPALAGLLCTLWGPWETSIRKQAFGALRGIKCEEA